MARQKFKRVPAKCRIYRPEAEANCPNDAITRIELHGKLVAACKRCWLEHMDNKDRNRPAALPGASVTDRKMLAAGDA